MGGVYSGISVVVVLVNVVKRVVYLRLLLSLLIMGEVDIDERRYERDDNQRSRHELRTEDAASVDICQQSLVSDAC